MFIYKHENKLCGFRKNNSILDILLITVIVRYFLTQNGTHFISMELL